MQRFLIAFALFGLFLAGCTKIVYLNESNIDYDLYTKGYIDYIDYNGYYFDVAEATSLTYFYERVFNKGGFETLYHYYQSVDTSYIPDLSIELNIVYYDARDYFDNSSDTYKYSVEISMDCIGRDAFGAEVFNFNTIREKTYNLDNDNRFFTELDREAFYLVLKEASEYFLKDFEL